MDYDKPAVMPFLSELLLEIPQWIRLYQIQVMLFPDSVRVEARTGTYMNIIVSYSHTVTQSVDQSIYLVLRATAVWV